MLKSNGKNEIIAYLKSQSLMTLATQNKKPWVCTVYFIVDNNLNIYFVSSSESRHVKEIEKNNEVAIAVYDSHIKNSGKKAGIQIEGYAGEVKDWKTVEQILIKWNKKHPGMEKVINITKMRNGEISSRVYQVRPKYIKYFNQNLGEDGFIEINI